MGGLQCLLVFALAKSARHAWTNGRRETLETLRGVRWWMFPLVLLAIPATVTVYLLLAQVPGLAHGWLSLVGGGSGSLMAGGGAGLGPFHAALSVAIVGLLFLAIPREAREEENLFRAGNHQRHWWRRLARAVVFGLVHLGMGIPVAAGLALILAGLLYDGTYESTFRRVHAEHQATAQRIAIHQGDGRSREYLAHAANLCERRAVAAASAIHTVWNYTLVLVLVILVIAVL